MSYIAKCKITANDFKNCQFSIDIFVFNASSTLSERHGKRAVSSHLGPVSVQVGFLTMSRKKREASGEREHTEYTLISAIAPERKTVRF